MKKEFVPYEQALTLKELGFDEPCIARWIVTDIRDGGEVKLEIWNDEDTEYEVKSSTKAPLFQQAFRWFREKYDLVIEPCVPFQRLYSTEEDHFEILEFGYRIYSFDQYRGGLRDKIEWDGYDNSNEEEAELECLKKLIEIVKNENK